MKKNYYSPRGEQLVFIGEPMDVPIITVENYTKWYTLFTIQPDGKVEPLIIDGWIDHNPIPVEVYKYAQQANMFVDEQSMEMIIGRFVQEKYESVCKETIYLEDSDNLCSYRGKPIRKYPEKAVDNTALLKEGKSYGFFTNGVDTLIRIDGIDYNCEMDTSGFDIAGDSGKAVKCMDEFFIVRYPITDSAPLKKIIVREKYIGEEECI